MQAPPLISIVVPAYNAGKWLEATLHSCLAQSYDHYEVVVIDDGSTDDTAAIAARYADAPGSKVRLVKAAHGGLGAARNLGVRNSTGAWLYYLDADDLVEPDALRQALELANAAGAQAVVGDWSNFVDDPERPTAVHVLPFEYPEDPIASLILRPVVCSAILWPRSDVAWDETIVSWEGQRYFMDVLPRLSRVARLPLSMVKVRQRSDSERLTIKYDHFEPAKALQFYADLKQRMTQRGFMTARRAEAIDYQLLQYAYAARRRGIVALGASCAAIDKARLRSYRWYRPLALSGVAAMLGARAGVETFYWINRLLGRV